MRYRERGALGPRSEAIDAFMHLEPSEDPDGTFSSSYPVLANSSISLLFHYERPARGDGFSAPRLSVYGPSDRFRVEAITPRTEIVGVRFRPGRGAAALGIDARSIAGLEVDIAEVAPSFRPLLESLLSCGGADEALATLESSAPIFERETPTASLRRVERATSLIDAEPDAFDARALAWQIGVTERTLRREFARHVGLSPVAYARVARFTRTRRAIASPKAGPLAELAVHAGYADQSHMNRDFRAMSGGTAVAMLRETRN